MNDTMGDLPAEEILKTLNSFIDRCRSISVPVAYRFRVQPSDLDPPPCKAPETRTNRVPVCTASTGDSEFPPQLNEPLPVRPVVTKRGYDAFVDQDHHIVLQNRGLKTLIFTMVYTGVSVDSSLKRGFHLGCCVVLAENATAASDPTRHPAACKLVDAHYRSMMSTNEIVQVWDSATERIGAFRSTTGESHNRPRTESARKKSHLIAASFKEVSL